VTFGAGGWPNWHSGTGNYFLDIRETEGRIRELRAPVQSQNRFWRLSAAVADHAGGASDFILASRCHRRRRAAMNSSAAPRGCSHRPAQGRHAYACRPQLARVGRGKAVEPDQPDPFVCYAPALGARKAAAERSLFDVLVHSHPGKNGILLKHHASSGVGAGDGTFIEQDAT
jgi:hypothetical protein